MIDNLEIDALMESTAVVVREYFAAERKKITAELSSTESRILEELRQRIKEIPAGPEGKHGESIVGPPGPAGKDGESIVGPEGKEGPPGSPGVDINPEHVRKFIEREVGIAIAELPKPKDGVDGRPGADFDPAEMRRQITVEVQCAFSALPQPKDGEPGQPGKDADPIHPDTISLMVVTEVAKAVALIPKAKDGEPGRHATQIDYLPAIDQSKSYPRGTCGYYNGGTIRAERHTTPIVDGIEKSGWVVAEDGIASVEEIPSDDPREFSIEIKRTSGASTVIKRYWPIPMYEQIWREGVDYRKGAMVTRDGSTWHCNTDHTKVAPGTPNTSDWTLCVKRGQNAKAEKGDKGEPGKDGKDFRPTGSKW